MMVNILKTTNAPVFSCTHYMRNNLINRRNVISSVQLVHAVNIHSGPSMTFLYNRVTHTNTNKHTHARTHIYWIHSIAVWSVHRCRASETANNRPTLFLTNIYRQTVTNLRVTERQANSYKSKKSYKSNTNRHTYSSWGVYGQKANQYDRCAVLWTGRSPYFER